MKKIACLIIAIFALAPFTGCTRLIQSTDKLPDPPREVRHAETQYDQSPTLERMLDDLAPGMPSRASDRLPREPVIMSAQGKYSALLKLVHNDYYNQKVTFTDPHVDTELVGIPNSPDQSPYLQNLSTVFWEPVVTIAADGTIQGNLFADWRVENDGLRHTITLREGLCWSDGTPVTANDVKFALDMFATDEPFMRNQYTGQPAERRRSHV